MKLAEALLERKDLKTKVDNLRAGGAKRIGARG